MAIERDTKDWTWVLDRPCPECGFDATTVADHDVAPVVRSLADRWRDALVDTPDAGRRTQDDRWSVLEYGCHVRDVFRIYAGRLELMLTEDDPGYPNWDQDRTALDERYGDQDPLVVAGEVHRAGHHLAEAFGRVAGDQWARTGRRSDGAHLEVRGFSRYLVHDPFHHLWDVGADLPTW